MVVNDILELARTQTGQTATDFPNTLLIDWANIVFKECVREIAQDVDENYFTITRTFDASSASDAYALVGDELQIKEVSFKWNTTDTYYQKAREVDFSKLPYGRDYYALYQPSGDSIFQVIGTDLVVAPQFTSDNVGGGGNNQMRYVYEPRQSDLAVGGAESTVTIPIDFHQVLAFGIRPYVYLYARSRGKTRTKAYSLNFKRRREEEIKK
jgi:hypothetical protein